MKYLDTPVVDLVFYGEVRASYDPRQFGGYFLSQQVKVDAHSNLGLGVNYTFVSIPSAGSAELKEQHRAELEATPHFKVADWLEVSARQRLELRWLEHVGGASERTRHRLQLSFPVHGAGRLTSLFLSDEVFYDYTKHRVTENRLVPAGACFQLSDHTSFSLSYMYQGQRPGHDWCYRHVLTPMLIINL